MRLTSKCVISYSICLCDYYFKERNAPKFILFIITGISAAMAAYKVVKNRKKHHEIVGLKAMKESERKANFGLIESLIYRSHHEGNYDELEKKHRDILKLNLDQLQAALQARKVTAQSVMEAYMIKSLQCAKEFNCVTEYLPTAMIKAKELDNLVLLKGPLHGIPFCVNDDIELQGTLPFFSCSVNSSPSTVSKDSAVIVKILESLGAIPFCRASISISCMAFGGRNPFFGEIHHPLNKDLSLGGSSCGSACLVKAGGAPFAIATDRAGGARLPAHLSGLTTLKPSRHRISRRGCVQQCVGSTSIPCIMTKRVSELVTLHGLIMEKNQQHRSDPKVVPLPWNTQITSSKQKLRIGFFNQFPAYPPLGDTVKAIEKAKIYLESCGHIVVKCEPPDDLKCHEVWNTLMKVHTYRHIVHEDESIEDNLHTTEIEIKNNNKSQLSPRVLWVDEMHHVEKTQMSGTSCWRKFLKKLDSIPGRKSARDKAMEQMHTTMNSDCDLWNTASLREQFVDEVLESMSELDVDVIICPVFSQPATTSENMIKLGLWPAIYTFVWNLLDLPAGVVRIWKEGGTQLSEKYESSVGMPIGVQIVGRPYREEMVLRVMVELDEIND